MCFEKEMALSKTEIRFLFSSCLKKLLAVWIHSLFEKSKTRQYNNSCWQKCHFSVRKKASIFHMFTLRLNSHFFSTLQVTLNRYLKKKAKPFLNLYSNSILGQKCYLKLDGISNTVPFLAFAYVRHLYC